MLVVLPNCSAPPSSLVICNTSHIAGASLLIDSITLTDTISLQTLTKSCCRSGGGSSSTLTSPGSGIIIALHDTTPPLPISDTDTPAPYCSNPPPSIDEHPLPLPPSRIGRCITTTTLNPSLSLSLDLPQVHTHPPSHGPPNCRPCGGARPLCGSRIQVGDVTLNA